MNKFLIRMMIYEEDKDYPSVICGFYSTKITELLKLYITAKECEIPIKVDNYSSMINSKFCDKEDYIVENIDIDFGTENSFTTLNIYVK